MRFPGAVIVQLVRIRRDGAARRRARRARVPQSDLTEHDDPPPPKYAKHAVESRMHGRITACEPPRLLAYPWGGTSGDDSEVRFELTLRADKVLLVVTYRRLATRDGMISVAGGWHAHLGILSDRLSGRKPPGFWATHTRLEAEYDRRIPARGN